MSSVPNGERPAVGLREHKKARTKAAIREHAMRLFQKQGYQATTVEQIAEAMAERVGRRPDELAVRTFAGAVLGAVLASSFAAAEDPGADVFARIDAGLAHLEAGLPP
jgi:MftR C-terminal domain/Bacterial regulatory proteins, tetR family